MRWEWIEHPTRGSSGPCSTNWATTAYLRENYGIRTHDQRSHNPLLYQPSCNLHNLCLRRNRTSIPRNTIVSFISSLLWYDIIRTLVTVTLQLPIYALNRHFVGREGLEPPVSNEIWFTVRAATNYRLPPHYLSGWYDSNVRSPLQHSPVPKTGEVYQLLHIQIIIFTDLSMILKLKKSFVITEEALYKLYSLATLITFLKIYFITTPISKRHTIKWSSTNERTKNRTNMWMNLTHAFYIFN